MKLRDKSAHRLIDKQRRKVSETLILPHWLNFVQALSTSMHPQCKIIG